MLNQCWITVTMVMEMLDACEHRDGGDRGSRYYWLAWLPGIPVYALRKDLVIDWPPGAYSEAPSYMVVA